MVASHLFPMPQEILLESTLRRPLFGPPHADEKPSTRIRSAPPILRRRQLPADFREMTLFGSREKAVI